MKVFLDLKNFQAERAQLRRLEKSLADTNGYLYKKGRVYFFDIPDYIQRANFFTAVMDAIRKTGHACTIAYEKEENL